MGTKRDAESEDYSEEPASDAPAEDASDGDYEAAPKAKKKAAPRKPAAKKKAAAAAGGDSDSDAGAAKKKAAPKKPRAKPAPKLTEPTAIGGGWTAHPPHLLVRAHPAFVGSAKVAALDLDGTLLRRPSGARFSPLDEHDWAWRNPGVPAKLKELADAGHALVIFSNQGSLKTALTGPGATKIRAMIDHALADLAAQVGDLPVQVLLATGQDEFRKPAPGMWRFFAAELAGGAAPDVAASFFCGDAAGRTTDFATGKDQLPASSDRDFAAAVGLKFTVPEELFGDVAKAPPPGAGSPNEALAAAFAELATLYREVSSDNFKGAAFAKVAAAVAAKGSKIAASKDMKGVPGVGKSSLAKIDEWLTTGTMGALEELRAAKGGGGPAAPPPTKGEAMAAKFI